IRWSSERAGAWACVFDVTIERTSLASCERESSSTVQGDLQGFFQTGNGDGACRERVREAPGSCLLSKLLPDPGGRQGIGEEDRAERHRARARRDELERVEPGRHSAHADDRYVDRVRARVDARERDGSEGLTRVSADRPREPRPE